MHVGYHHVSMNFFMHIGVELHVLYSPENKPPSKISLLPSMTSKFLHRYFYLVYKPPPLCCKNCTVSKNECVSIDRNAVICSLDGLSSSLVSSFC